TRWLRGLVQHGIDVARERGCGVVSLGQYTSVVMRNGAAVRPGPVGITTGNAYAVALALEAIERAAPDLACRTVAVVGAAGTRAPAAARPLGGPRPAMCRPGPDPPGAPPRMQRLQIPGARLSTRAEDCRDADVVVVSVSTPAPVVRGEHLARGALVCD